MAGKQEDVLDQLAAFFEKARARDALFRMVMHWAQVMAWRMTVKSLTAPKEERPAARKAAAKYRKLAGSLSEFRQVVRFFKWVATVRDVQGLINGTKSLVKDIDASDVVEGVSALCDNISYLGKMDITNTDAKLWAARSEQVQLLGSFVSTAIDALRLSGHLPCPRNTTSREVSINLAKNSTAFLQSLIAGGSLSQVPKPLLPAVVGTLGATSSGIETYQLWISVTTN